MKKINNIFEPRSNNLSDEIKDESKDEKITTPLLIIR